MIALYPGAFKPPHRGHFEVVKGLLNGNHGGDIYTKDSGDEVGAKVLAGEKGKVQKIDKIVIFLGGGERNGITKGESKAIWEIYSKYLGNVEIVDGQINPMMEAKEYAKARPEEQFYAVTGLRGEEDFIDLRRITTFSNRENVQGLAVPSLKGAEVRATDLRKAVLDGSLDDIRDFFPKELNRQELLRILKMLKDNIISELLEQNIEKLFNDMFVKEGSSGTPIAPQSVVRSSDRQKLEYLYNYLKNIIPSEAYIKFMQDRIQISYEENHPYDSGKTVYEGQGVDSKKLTEYIGSILEYMLDEGMNIQPLPEVKIKRDAENAANFFGKTAYYDPNQNEIVLYVEGRHMKDVTRSFVHEMIHHIQNLEGRLNNIKTSNTNEDDHLLEIEKEAYLKGNITFRNWEDSIKNPKEDVDGKKAFSREVQINEDSKYDEYEELASKLAEDITRAFYKHSDISNKLFRLRDNIIEEINGVPFNFKLDVKLQFDKKIKDIDAQAYAVTDKYKEDEDKDDDLIEVEIDINPNLAKKYQIIELALFHFLVHELEHLVHGEGVNRINDKFIDEDPTMRTLIDQGGLGDGEEANTEYKVLPREVASGVKELAARAKATGNSFDKEVEQELDKAGITTPKYRKQVKGEYKKYITKNNIDLEINV